MRDSLQIYTKKMEPRTVGALESDTLDFGGQSDYGKSDTANFFQVRLTDTFAGGSGAKLKIELKHSDDNSTFVTAISTGEIEVADLTAGKLVICQPIPTGFKRYSKVVATVSGAAMTDGTFTAWLGFREED